MGIGFGQQVKKQKTILVQHGPLVFEKPVDSLKESDNNFVDFLTKAVEAKRKNKGYQRHLKECMRNLTVDMKQTIKEFGL